MNKCYCAGEVTRGFSVSAQALGEDVFHNVKPLIPPSQDTQHLSTTAAPAAAEGTSKRAGATSSWAWTARRAFFFWMALDGQAPEALESKQINAGPKPQERPSEGEETFASNYCIRREREREGGKEREEEKQRSGGKEKITRCCTDHTVADMRARERVRAEKVGERREERWRERETLSHI